MVDIFCCWSPSRIGSYWYSLVAILLIRLPRDLLYLCTVHYDELLVLIIDREMIRISWSMLKNDNEGVICAQVDLILAHRQSLSLPGMTFFVGNGEFCNDLGEDGPEFDKECGLNVLQSCPLSPFVLK